MSLIIKNLSARVKDGAQILNGINLEIPKGQVHAIMGPNGSGKSTLSKVLCGHPDYEVIEGTAELDGQDLFAMSVDERSRAGLFLAFQYPVEVPGVTNANFMRAALQARLPKGEELDAVSFYKTMRSKMAALGMDTKFTARAVNEGFLPALSVLAEEASALRVYLDVLAKMRHGAEEQASALEHGANRLELELNKAGILNAG
jgi:Fe-S cluster assembly ATP-binding protein